MTQKKTFETSFILLKSGVVLICYIEILIPFSESEMLREDVHRALSKKLKITGRVEPLQVPVI